MIFKPLKDNRSLALFIVLSILTGGIYSFIFMYEMKEDINVACAGDGEETKGIFVLFLLSILTCGIYAFYWYYKFGQRLANNAPRYGLYFKENGTTVLLWLLFGWLLCGVGQYVGLYYMISNLNKLSSAYNAYNYSLQAEAYRQSQQQGENDIQNSTDETVDYASQQNND